MARRRPSRGLVAVGAIVAVSAAARFLAALTIPGPWIAPDEMAYGLLGQSLYRDAELEILGGPTPFVSLVYPALVGLPLALDDLELGYSVVKALQAVVMSLAAVPVFLWARELVSERWALGAAALTVAIPGLAYSGLIMTEVAFYPIVLLALWAASRALADPTPTRQATLVALVALAALTRLQAAVLIPAFVTALGLHAGFTRSLTTVRRFTPTLVGLFALSLAWSAWQLRNGGPWTRVLGVYAPTGESEYGLADALQWVAHHAGTAVLFTGLFPACALALLVVGAVRRGERSARTAAFLAVTTSYTLWLVAQVGVFASRHVLRLAERDLLTLAPLFFVALALWLDRGGARSRVASGAVAFVAAAAVLAIPPRRLAEDVVVPDSPTLAALQHAGGDVAAVVYVGVAAAALLFALLPRRALAVLPALLLAALVAASVGATREYAERSEDFQTRLVGSERRWIDRSATGPAAYVYGGDAYWNAVWAHAFWNRRLVRVLDLPPARVPGPMPQAPTRPRPDGRLDPDGRTRASVRYAVAGTAIAFAGTPIAVARQEGTGQQALVLWRLDQPFRVSHTTSGVLENGDMYDGGRLTVYGCDGGYFAVTLIAKGSRRVEIRRDGEPYAATRFRTGDDTWSTEVPAPPEADGSGTCTFEVVPDDFLGSTRFEFVRG